MSNRFNLTEHDAWEVTTRWQQFDGERRANYLRVLVVVSFFVVHLLNYYRPFPDVFSDAPVDKGFHLTVTVLVVAWLSFSFGIHLAIQARFFPKSLSFASTLFDVVLVTTIICVGRGTQSPLIPALFLILVLAGLRLHLQLIQFSTVACSIAYLYVMLWESFRTSEQQKPSAVLSDESIGVSQIINLLAIVICGVMLGQLVRRLRPLSRYYAARICGQDQNATANSQVEKLVVDSQMEQELRGGDSHEH